MAVGKKETLIARAYLSPNGFSKHKVPAMAAAKIGGIKRAERDAKQLTDLMERFNTLSGLYETERKSSFQKENTFHEGARASTKDKASELDADGGENASVPKPVPPYLAHGRLKKSSLKKSEAKLHAGIGVGIGVFRLKDSLPGEKVLQSVPQDDVQYSFHQPHLVKRESTLYHQALASSRKYVLANGGDVTKQTAGLSLKRTEKSSANIAKGYRRARDDGAAVSPGEKAFQMGTHKANTIGDFNLGNKRLHKQKRSFRQTRAADNVVLTKDKSNARKGLDATLGGETETQKQKSEAPVELVSERALVGEKPNTSRNPVVSGKVANRKKKPKPLKHTTSPATAALVDFSAPTTTSREFEDSAKEKVQPEDCNRQGEILSESRQSEQENGGQKSELITEKATSTTIIRMPKFVRTNEEMLHSSFERKGLAKSALLESRLDMSASSYYLSTYPKNPASLSSMQSGGGRSRYSPDSKMSPSDCLSRTEMARRLDTIVSSLPPSPSTEGKNSIPETYSNLSSSVNKRNEPRKSKEKAPEVRKQQRRPLARKQGHIKKTAERLKDPQLETLIQGHSFAQNATDEPADVEQVEEKENNDKSEDKKAYRREKSKSGGSGKKLKDPMKKDDKEDNKLPVFNAYESFVIKSKHHIQGSSMTSPDASDLKASKLPQKPQGKLAPLMKLNTELRKSKFILARTERSIDETSESPVRLVSDPITFSVRHPPHVTSNVPTRESPRADKPPRDLLLGRLNGFRNVTGEKERTVVVFFHHDAVSKLKNKDMVLHTQPRYSAVYKNTLTSTKEEISGSDQMSFSGSTKVGTQKSLEKGELSEGQINFETVTNKGKKRKSDSEESLNRVAVKTTGAGGFKPNAAQYSMLMRQHRLFKDDQETFLRLMRNDFLRNQSPETAFTHSLPRSTVFCPKKTPDPEMELASPPKLTTMLKKFAHASPDLSQRPTGYTVFTSAYPIKHDSAVEHMVQMHDPKRASKRVRQSLIRLNYVWPDPRKRFPHLAANSMDAPIKSHASRSTGSDVSSSKSLKITDLNLELNPEERGRQFFMPKLGKASARSKSQDRQVEMDRPAPKHPHYTILTLPQIHRRDLIREDDEEVEEQDFEDLNSYLCIDAHTASILPDPGTTSYRLTHDVSFDEGSRYRTADFPHGLKGNGDPHGQLSNLKTLSHQFGSAASKRNCEPLGASSQLRHDGRIGAGRDLGSQSKHGFKDSFSLLKMEDRFAGDLPPTTSPPSSASPSAIAAPSSFMPPPSASQGSNAPTNASGGGSVTFRLNKRKQNWNYKLGNLAIDGGGYPNQCSLIPNAKREVDSVNSMSLISAVQRNFQARERAAAAGPKSRLSMRYSTKADGANGASYADPCVAAAPSFQQRLTDLSILESETIKYERNRKSRRKKNQDKES